MAMVVASVLSRIGDSEREALDQNKKRKWTIAGDGLVLPISRDALLVGLSFAKLDVGASGVSSEWPSDRVSGDAED